MKMSPFRYAAIALLFAGVATRAAAQAPTIIVADVSQSTINLGDSFDLTVAVRNTGFYDSPLGVISVTFPNFTYSTDASQVTWGLTSSDLTQAVYVPGQDVINKSDGYSMIVRDLLLEGTDTNWTVDELNTVTLHVTPTHQGTFVVQVRAALRHTSQADIWLRDPATGSGDDTDQQGWDVYDRLVTVQVVQPNLRGSISVSPSSATTQDDITLGGSVSNNGNAAAGAFTWAYRYNGITLHSGTVSGLAAGASTTLPSFNTATWPAGSYQFDLVVDTGNDVAESNESDNTSSATANVVDVMPDLAVTSFSPAASSALPGATLNVQVAALNQGNATAPAGWSGGVYLSTNSSITTSDTRIGGWTQTADLYTNTGVNRTVTATIPAGTAPGNYYIGLLVDENDVVNELSETNNTAASAFTVTVPPPDLVVTRVTAPSSVTAGNVATVSYVVRNQGSGSASSPGELRVYLSTDNAITTSDIELDATSPGTSLAPGDSLVVTRNVTMPLATAAGAYYFGAMADASGVVSESDEANNTRAASGTTTVRAAPDLVAVAPTVDPATPSTLDSLAIRGVVRNTGGDAATFDYALTLGSTVLTSGTATLGSSDSLVLQPQAAPQPAGIVALTLQVDTANAVPEADEGNNTATTNVTVTEPPDLAAQSFTLATTAMAPGAGPVDGNVVSWSNAGGGPATVDGGWTLRVYLSTDANVDGTDVLLVDTLETATLAAGASTSMPIAITVPSGTAPGTYQLAAMLDARDQLAEGDETNNVVFPASTLEILPPADVTLSVDTLRITALEGADPAPDTILISNAAVGSAAPGWTAAASAGWLELTGATGDSLAPGSTDTVAVQVRTDTLPLVSGGELAPGTYVGRVSFDEAAGAGDVNGLPDTVVVVLQVQARAVITLSPDSLSLSMLEGGSSPAPSVVLRNDGGTTLSWSAAAGTWLAPSPAGGTTAPGDSVVIDLAVSSGLAAGVYVDTLLVSDPAASNSPQGIPVRLTVRGPEVALQPDTILLTTTPGVDPAATTVVVGNGGGGTLNWTLAPDSGWLTPGRTTGSLGAGATDTVALTAALGGRGDGTYETYLVATDPAAAVPADTTVVRLLVQSPVLALSLDTVALGEPSTILPVADSFVISNAGDGVLDWQVAWDSSWLEVAPVSGSLTGAASDTVVVSADPGTMAPGAYLAWVHVTAGAASGAPDSVAVTITVPTYPIISTSPDTAEARAVYGRDVPVETSFVVANVGTDTLRWSASMDSSWATPVPDSGSTPPGMSDSVVLRLDPTGLSEGVHLAHVMVLDPGAPAPEGVTVRLHIDPAAAVMLEPDTLRFDVVQGGLPDTLAATIANTGGDTLHWAVQADSAWITVTQDSGVVAVGAAPDTVRIIATPGTRTAGEWHARLIASDRLGSSEDTTAVVLRIGTPPAIALNTDSLGFTLPQGDSTAVGHLVVTNAGADTLRWTATTAASWLAAQPGSGLVTTDSDTIALTASAAGQAPGLHSTWLRINAPLAPAPDSVLVTLRVLASAAFSVDSTSLSLETYTGLLPDSVALTLANEGELPTTWRITSSSGWLNVRPTAGTLGAGESRLLYVSVNPDSLGAGTYTASITIGSDDPAVSSVTVGVGLVVHSTPSVDTQQIVAHLFGTATLANDVVAYLDFIGNQNGLLDVGDLQAWLQHAATTSSTSVTTDSVSPAIQPAARTHGKESGQ